MFNESHFNDQHLFVRVFERAPIGMALVSPEGRIQKVNKSLCHMLGYGENELTGQGFQSITHSEDLDMNLNLFHKALDGEIDSYEITKRFMHKSGRIVWVLLSTSLECDDQENPAFFISQLVDITAQKEKEEELKKMKDLHRLISEHAQDIMISCTPEGFITYISPAVRQHLGYEPEELVGKYCYDFWHPEDLDNWLIQGNQESRNIVYRIRHKNGHYVWHETNSKKIQNDKGEIQHIIGIGRDVTERKNIELRLQEIEQRHRSLLNYSPIGICAVNLQGVFLEVNPAFEKMTGYDFTELCSMTVMDLAPLESISSGEEVFQTSLLQEMVDLELLIKNKDGSYLDVLVSSSPMIINGKITGVYIYNKDITEQKKTEKQLQNTEKLSLLGELAAGIAHEIRNPLTSLRGFVQFFQQGDLSDEKQLYYKVMLSEIDRINEIVSELLVLAKPSREEFDLRSISDMLNEVITLLEAQANLVNIEIKKEFAQRLPSVVCNSSMKQVFINLLKNAMESMPHGGEVCIQVKKKQDHICIRMTDQGCGIPSDQLYKVGQPFYTTKEAGTGLGLMVSHRIVQNHKGSIQLESEEGKGTVVEVLLPVD